MVHTFRCLDRFFMLDTESGSVFETDRLIHDFIANMHSPLDVTKGEFSRYTEEEINEAREEIEALTKEGILFSKEQPHHPPVYSGIVKAMCLNISHKCNLACSYCFADGGSYASKAENMPLETAKAAVDFLIEKSGGRQNLEIDFFGGEPFLNYDVVKSTVGYALSRQSDSKKRFKFTITTNAFGLTEEQIAFLNEAFYNVVISIDGREAVHDCVRKTAGGKPSHKAVLANALRFRALRGDKQYYIRGTFTAKNLDFSKDVLYLSDAGFDQISIEPVVLDHSHPLAIRSEHLDAIGKEYERLAAAYLLRRKDAKKWFNFFHFMLDLENGPCEHKRLTGCSAGNEYVAVSPSGTIYPCHQFDGKPDYSIGNVLDKTFSVIIPEKFTSANLLQKDKCLQCWAKYYCGGGCASNNMNYGGGINKPFQLSCDIFRKRLECAFAVRAIENENTKR